MSEVNPGPVAKLARFTPAPPLDAAELLFAAGRASARTHWAWKAAVAALALSTLTLGAFLAFGPRDVPPAAPAPAPVVQQQPEPVTVPPVSAPLPTDEPWSYRTLRAMDLEQSPTAEPIANLAPHKPLTALSGRRGDID